MSWNSCEKLLVVVRGDDVGMRAGRRIEIDLFFEFDFR